MLTRLLPAHPRKQYPASGACIYCGASGRLTDEHIIPYGLGGRWVLPDAACTECARITGMFERTCLRTMFGPLRMHFDLPTRRRTARPKALPLKVKIKPDDDWSYIDVEREAYPFLVLFPQYQLPDEISGSTTTGRRDSATNSSWIRAASFRDGLFPHLEYLCQRLGVASVMPTAKCLTTPFCLMVAKIAHAFAIAELGNSFQPFLSEMILRADTSNCKQYVGGLPQAEPASASLHELSFDFGSERCARRGVIVVRIRLLASLETPTYYVAAGRV